MIEFRVETTTSAFVHGIDQRQRAEMRASAIEGAMRYWFRAVTGAVLDDQPCGEQCGRCARCVEGFWFGDTVFGRVLTVRVVPRVESSHTAKLLPHRDGTRAARSAAIPPGKSLTIQLQPRARARAAGVTAVAAGSLWIALALGGVGQRSRRGAGSLAITEIIGCTDLSLPALPPSLRRAEFVERLKKGLSTARVAIRNRVAQGAGAKVGATEAPTLQRVRVVALDSNHTDEQRVRAKVMLDLRKHKSAAFGLPYMRPATGDKNLGGSARHASPVWIHLARTREGWVMVQTLVDTRHTIADAVKTAGGKFRWEDVEEYLSEGKEIGTWP